MDGYWKRVRNAAKTSRRIAPPSRRPSCVADTDAEAEDVYREHVRLLLQPLPAHLSGFRGCTGVSDDQDAEGRRHDADDSAGTGRRQPNELGNRDDGYVIAGSPDTVASSDEGADQRSARRHMFCLIHVGNMPKERCMRSSKLFAEEVIPQLRGMWSEYANDDRFWIHPLGHHAPRAAAAAIGG